MKASERSLRCVSRIKRFPLDEGSKTMTRRSRPRLSRSAHVSLTILPHTASKSVSSLPHGFARDSGIIRRWPLGMILSKYACGHTTRIPTCAQQQSRFVAVRSNEAFKATLGPNRRQCRVLLYNRAAGRRLADVYAEKRMNLYTGGGKGAAPERPPRSRRAFNVFHRETRCYVMSCLL